MHICTYLSTIPIIFSLISTSSASEPPLRLPKVVVRGAGIPAPTPLDSADVTRITAIDLEQQQAVTLVDALRRVPGVNVTQLGGIGQPASVSLRGSGTGQTAFILDGMHINDVGAPGGEVNLASLLVDDIAEIRVIRGPFSSLYGSDAIGGAVLMDTKKGKGPHKTFAKAEAGSFHTYQQVVGLQGQKDLFDYQVTGTRLQSAGSPLTPERLRPLLVGKADDPLHQENISARFGVGKEEANISYFGRYITRRLGYRDNRDYAKPNTDPYRVMSNESFNRLLGHFEANEGKWVHDVSLAKYQNNREDQNDLGLKRSDNKGKQSQVDWHQTLKLNETMTAQIVTQFAQDQFYFHYIGRPFKQAKLDHGGLGGVLSVRVLESLSLSTAVRGDKYQGIPVAPTWRVGGEYGLFDFIFKGGIATGFKAPTLSQRYEKGPRYDGNPSLKPEKSLGWDVGAERSFFNQKLALGVTLFQNRTRDMITWAGNTYTNRNRVRSQGLEGIAKVQVMKDWVLELTHTYMQVWDEQSGLAIVRNPHNKTTLCVIGQITPEWQVSANILYVGGQYDLKYDALTFTSARIKMPSYTTFGVETSYQLNEQWQAYGRGENLTNHRYENPYGFQQPGLGFYVGLRLKC